ncbi:MAG: hypothetical protein N0E56_15740 [Candidatus Thiodiazotropha endolucinida]|nr:hypothetical protein [Candidatus Thiodiazotropha taylori]MCW4268075.1 hypothetical protein [Candidatus Thiodiazotropha endolucinida]
MSSPNKIVLFLNKKTAEEMLPIENGAMISITDCRDDEADINDQWGHVYRFRFIDGSYNEDSLRFVGLNYKYIYSSYFDRAQAVEMNQVISNIVNDGINTIVVHCHAGRSRSAAVAKYISDRYGYLPYNTKDVLPPSGNQTSPNYDDLSGMNGMIYMLLNDPGHFDSVIQDIESANQKPRQESWRHRLIRTIFG